MPTTRPCIVGTMGSTTYYQTTMTGLELASSVRPAKETDSWATSGIEERMQRIFDMKRIRATIVPYLAEHEDRFFGSLIVLVPTGSLEFEPLDEIVAHPLNALYREPAHKMGFLTIDDCELIALDGQHRLLALKEVLGSKLVLGEHAAQVRDDEIGVLFIEHEDSKKTRRLFSKVNRHAKPTGRSDNILTSEDDGAAIVTRWLLDVDRHAPLAERRIDGLQVELVNWKSNTLGQNSRHLTTIGAVYETVKSILAFEGLDDIHKRKSLVTPSEVTLEIAFEIAAEWWNTILTMDAFVNALADLGTVAGTRHDCESPHSLLLRPVGQVAMVKGIITAVGRSGASLTLTEAVRRANKIDWSNRPSSIWRGSIVRADGRVTSRPHDVLLAADLVGYLIGDDYMTEAMRHNLWIAWNKARCNDVENGVDTIADDRMPEGLPRPLVA